MNRLDELILQLHAEGDAAVTAPATAEPAAAPASTEPAVSGNNEPPVARNGQQATFGLRVDKLTGRRSVVMINHDEPQRQEEPAETPAAQQAAEPQQAEPQKPAEPQAAQQPQAAPDNTGTALFGGNNDAPEPYRDTAELLAAIQNNTVDERRIPMEQAFAYANYKQQMLQAQRAQQAQAQQQPQQNAAMTREQFFARIEDAARAATLKDLNLTEEQLATAEYADDIDLQARAARFDASLAWNRNAIMAQVQAEQQRIMNQRATVQQIYNDINAKVAEYSKTEPEWAGINNLMSTYFWKMPHEEAVKYAAAINAYNSGNITEAQAQDLQEYYDKTRVAYYAKKNNLGTVNNPAPPVPKVEQPGNGGKEFKDNAVTKEQLRNARDYRARRALIGAILSKRQ